MDRMSCAELADWQRAGRHFELLDVRRAAVRRRDASDLPGARWLDPERVLAWKDEIARDRPVVVYCAQGHEVGQGVAATLRAMGLDARYLIDGFAGWQASGRPLQPHREGAGR
jgi:rhodanese-related sulfurtransferase